MSISARVSLVAWEDRLNDFIFVAVPDERGRYLRTDKSVAVVACPVCQAMVGEPCIGRQGYNGTTHHLRRGAARAYRGQRQDDVHPPAELPGAVPDEHMEFAS